MSRTFSRLNTSIRSLSPSFSSSSSSISPQAVTARRYSAAVFKQKPSDWKVSRESQPAERHLPRPVYADAEEGEDEGGKSSQRFLGHRNPSPFGRDKHKDGRPAGHHRFASSQETQDVDYSTMHAPNPIFAEHLNGLFPELQFPKELARRILTHASHPAAVYGHNAGLSFMGRRVLNAYLFLLLSSSPNLKPTDDLEEIVSQTLNHYVLGEHLGSKWGLGRVMRWTPTIKSERLKNGLDQTALLKGVGLYKVQGDAVAAVMGGIFQQFGASVAHRVFHTRILPHILLTKGGAGLPEAFHGDARSACNRFGGMQGKLLKEFSASATNGERSSQIAVESEGTEAQISNGEASAPAVALNLCEFFVSS